MSTEIDHADVFDLLHQGIHEQVLPHLTDPHARSSAEAIALILRGLKRELDDTSAWTEDFILGVLELVRRPDRSSIAPSELPASILEDAAILDDVQFVPDIRLNRAKNILEALFVHVWSQPSVPAELLATMRHLSRMECERGDRRQAASTC